MTTDTKTKEGIPRGWKWATLGDIARESSLRNSGAFTHDDLYGVFKGQGLIPMDDRVKGAGVDRCKVVRPGAFAYNPMRLNIGSIACSELDRDVIVSPDYVVFETNESTDWRYVNHLRHSDIWTQFVSEAGSGSVRVRIYFKFLKHLSIPLPPLSEQRRIAEVLGSVDAAIAATESVIAKTRTLKRALLHRLLTRGIGHTEFKQTEIGQIPESWGVVNFGDICNVVRGGSPRPAGDPKYFNGDFIPWLTVKDVTSQEGIYLLGTHSALTEEGSKQSRILPEGTLVLSNSGATLGVPKIIGFETCANDGIAAFLEIKPTCNKEFAYFFLSTITEHLRNNVAPGLGQPNLNTSIIADISLPLPPLSEQNEIVDKIGAIVDDIFENKKVLNVFHETKHGLMQDLLTGKVRV